MNGGAAVIGGVVGAAAGLMLVRPAYRLSVPPGTPARTECGACSATLRWVAWADVHGNCDGCRSRLGPPGWLLATASGVAGAGIGGRFGYAWELPPYLLVTLLGVLLAAIDFAVMRLPDLLVKPGFAGSVGLLTGIAAIESGWWWLLRALIAALLLAGIYLLLALLPGGNLGFGDVKLAGLLGLYLGWLGWGELVAGAALPFVLNGVVIIGLLAARRVGRKTLVPFGPAMLVGAWLAVVALPIFS